MTLNYTENRIKEALRLNNGNVTNAKKQIFAWLYEDHKLLLDMTRPHLNGITAFAVSRVLARMTKTDDEILAEQATEVAQSPARKKSLGKDILRGFASKDSQEFGHENFGIPLRAKAASQNHVDVMHMLAASTKKKLSEK